jgi:two-component system, sensor histidine kinase
LINLLGNALKFTERGGVAVLVAPVGDRMRFSVSDSGIGIDPSFLPRMYEAFSQADSSMTRRFGGTGLGLAIVKRLAEAMGGRVDVSSELGRGSHFWVDLPLPEAAVLASEQDGSAARAAEWASACAENARDVLVVEDSPVNRELIAIYLQNEGFRVQTVTQGQEALDAIMQRDFGLVLMDLQMPILDGLEAVRRLRAWEAAQHRKRTPVVALTAHAREEVADTCRKAGFDGYLAKPFTRDALLDSIRTALSPRR